MRVKGVDHLALVVSDIDRSVKFYQQVFEGEIGRSRGVNEKDKAANRSRHTLVKAGTFAFDLFQMDPDDPPKPRARHLHFAFEIDGVDLDAFEQHLKKLGVAYDGPKAHGGGAGLSLYFRDPDGYLLEFTAKFRDPAAYEAEVAKRGAQYGGEGRTYQWREEKTPR